MDQHPCSAHPSLLRCPLPRPPATFPLGLISHLSIRERRRPQREIRFRPSSPLMGQGLESVSWWQRAPAPPPRNPVPSTRHREAPALHRASGSEHSSYRAKLTAGAGPLPSLLPAANPLLGPPTPTHRRTRKSPLLPKTNHQPLPLPISQRPGPAGLESKEFSPLALPPSVTIAPSPPQNI